jgi:hypothetical protein
MSARKKAAPLIEKLRALITEARVACTSPNSAPAVSHTMLSKPFLKRIARLRGVRMHLIASGINNEVRRYLKGTDEDDGVDFDQLKLWPENLRDEVKAIDRSRVFVPSRGEFVELVPSAIDAKETREAGEYLVAKGEDCIRVGNALKRLARRMP